VQYGAHNEVAMKPCGALQTAAIHSSSSKLYVAGVYCVLLTAAYIAAVVLCATLNNQTRYPRLLRRRSCLAAALPERKTNNDYECRHSGARHISGIGG
jgi:hypothetical protein